MVILLTPMCTITTKLTMHGRNIFLITVWYMVGIISVMSSICFQWKSAIPGRDTGHVIHRYQPIGISSCSKECLIRRSCASVNYDSMNLLCELVGQKNKHNPLLDRHFKHINKIAMHKKIHTGVCNDGLCAVGQRCTVIKHSYKCVQTECSPLNYGGVTLQDSSTTEIGSEIKMVCENKRNISIPISFRCLPSGRWENMDLSLNKCKCIQVEGFQMSNDKMSDKCYKPVDQVQTYNTAAEGCTNLTRNGHLAFPLSHSSKTFACRLITSFPGKDKVLWTGGVWINTHTIVTTLSLGNISATSVSGLGTFMGAGCLVLNCTDLKMTAQNCNTRLPFVCEKDFIAALLSVGGQKTPEKCFPLDRFREGRLLGCVLRKLEKVGPLSCVKECLLRQSCFSINYDIQALTCEINYANLGSCGYSLKDSDGYLYIEKRDMQHMVRISPCKTTTCGENQRCEILASGLFLCSITGKKRKNQ
ncbi:uncharacterized protein LOC134237886 [Saccostrea cucullata]|uniref:uncharacterized protein LOC134237886 n=1 Tax=Saccostrea cuccullata TaxID=36930 RepID=UPI002ED50E36